MGADCFDDALRRFSTTRRPLVGLVIGGLLGAKRLDETAANKKKKKCAKKCSSRRSTSKRRKCIRPDQQTAVQGGWGNLPHQLFAAPGTTTGSARPTDPAGVTVPDR